MDFNTQRDKVMTTRHTVAVLHKSISLMRRFVAVFVLALAAITLSACSNDSNTDNNSNAELNSSMLDANTATVVYRFLDSSLPPEFHRSYEITSDANTSSLTIDSYGDILDSASMATDFDALSLVLTKFEQSELAERIGFSNNGCVGGRSSFLTLYQSSDLETPVRSVGVYECDSEEAPAAMLELRNIIDPVLEPFDVATRIENTRQ